MQFTTLNKHSKNLTTLVSNSVHAGFPSPAEDYIDKRIDLNEHLINNPAATFMVRVEGLSMVDCGINEGDVLLVDRALTAKDNDVILAVVDGEFTVKRLIIKKDKTMILRPENVDFQEIIITQDVEFQVWGVVTYVIHKP
ncbi:MAG: LexA family protein [Patescibacteria group bacterium]